MCAFGGTNLDTLFVTSLSRPGITHEEDPYAGRIFALQPGVKGLAEPQFKINLLRNRRVNQVTDLVQTYRMPRIWYTRIGDVGK